MRENLIWVAVSVVGIWLAVALASIFSPDLVTNSTRIPIAAIVSPIFGAFATFATLFVALLSRGK
ncbi:MAG: hypothetical protein KAV43_01980 [Hadesarchaea archaeon]|nr:hypothetical protein [Hadesarchaea archaeon]